MNQVLPFELARLNSIVHNLQGDMSYDIIQAWVSSEERKADLRSGRVGTKLIEEVEGL